MDRRKFFGVAAAGLGGLTIFPRKSESAQSQGLSHEQMAQVVLKHPHGVYLHGNARSFGKSRLTSKGSDKKYYGKYYSEWHDAPRGDEIDPDGIVGGVHGYKRTKSVAGCVVRVDICRPDILKERLFDISNPLLKVICCGDWHFARLGEKWVEL